MTNKSEHSERTIQHVHAYFEATQSGDADVWANCFAEDAVVEDPVGQPPLRSPKAIRAQGVQFIEAFQEVGLYADMIHVAGNRAAATWTGRGTTKDGRRVTFEGIDVFTFDDEGRIAHMLGFWDPEDMHSADEE